MGLVSILCFRAAGLAAAFVLMPVGAYAEEPFRDLSFDDACKAAKKDTKVVMMDFYTTWCPPCKLLDRTTWKDAKVQAWMREKTIAIKIDVERNRKLAGQFSVMAYPTLIFARPDGRPLLTLIGYRDAQQFLSEVKDVRGTPDGSAGTTIPPAAAANAPPPAAQASAVRMTDPNARMRAGEALVRDGKYKEALDEYLWCYDHGREADPSFHSARLSLLLNDAAQLGKTYAPAQKALEQRRDVARAVLLSGKGGFDAASDYASLCRQFNDVPAILAVYDTLRPQGDAAMDARAVLLDEVLDQLIVARRYKDILDDARNVLDKMERALQMSQGTTERAKKDPYMKGAAEHVKQQAIQEGGNYYEALVGAGKKEEAAKLADRLIEFDGSGRTYAALIQHARRAGATDVADGLAQRGRTALPEKERRLIE